MSWDLFKRYSLFIKPLDLLIDASRIGFDDAFLSNMQAFFNKALLDMQALERGDEVNTDEKRMVGHYWLRNSKIAPNQDIQKSIEETITAIHEFAHNIHTGAIQGASGTFKYVLCVGIGGSALGPQFVASALGKPKEDKMKVFFVDNTDPDGIDYVLESLDGLLGQTLCIVTSKSGATPEPRNAMLEVQQAYTQKGLNFADHAVAITSQDSQLDKYAAVQGWVARFPMWDWVGGRTSELAAVGLVPAALQGIDILAMLEGAKATDQATRQAQMLQNPAALLALAWYKATNGKGEKDMVVLPYKDRLMLFSRYLQQLIMESLGKELNRENQKVYQGIAVYGNKGSTDQHAYVQQLRDGVNNFFVTFIEVLKDRKAPSMAVEGEFSSGDYLQAFLLGTRDALIEKERTSITLTIKEVTPFTIGMLIALYERAVSFYASFVNINAYHQPGVEAGKKAANCVLNLKTQILNKLKEKPGVEYTADELAIALGCTHQTELVYKLLKHASLNKKVFELYKEPFYESKFLWIKN